MGTLLSCYTRGIVTWSALGLMLGCVLPGQVEAQGLAGLLDRVQRLEGQVARYDRSWQTELAVLRTEVESAQGQAVAPTAAAGTSLDSLVARLVRLEVRVLVEPVGALTATAEGSLREAALDSIVVVLERMTTRMEAMAAAPFVAPAPAPAPAPAWPVIFGGQIRPRFESRRFDGTTGGSPDDWFTSMRVRGTVTAELEHNVRAVIDFQDVRLWGEEGNTLGDFRADNFDLHQGYLEISGIGGRTMMARVGRQAMAFGEQRLIGAVDWAQQGRSFDGARITFGSARAKVDAFAMVLSESSAPNIEANALLAGGYVNLASVAQGALDLYLVYDRVSGEVATSQNTVGFQWYGARKGLSYRMETSYQVGTRAGTSVHANMVGIRVGSVVGSGGARVTFWYDRLSGDDPSDPDSQAFSTLFATNHKFYGFADLFLDIPKHTAGHGLQDFAVKLSVPAGPRTSVNVDAHMFRAASAASLVSAHFADEVDVTVSRKITKELAMTGGFSLVKGRPGLAEIGRYAGLQTHSYIMTSVVF